MRLALAFARDAPPARAAGFELPTHRRGLLFLGSFYLALDVDHARHAPARFSLCSQAAGARGLGFHLEAEGRPGRGGALRLRIACDGARGDEKGGATLSLELRLPRLFGAWRHVAAGVDVQTRRVWLAARGADGSSEAAAESLGAVEAQLDARFPTPLTLSPRELCLGGGALGGLLQGATLLDCARGEFESALENLARAARCSWPPAASPEKATLLLRARPLHAVCELDVWRPSDPLNRAWVPLARHARRPHSHPRVIHCHDMAGGYGEDDAPHGSARFQRAYNFKHWNLVDIFVYFTHSRVGVPPAAWVNAAHANGVPVLGSVTFEWEDGAADALRLLEEEEEGANAEKSLLQRRVERLAEMCAYYGFDGWFLNVESRLPGEAHVRRMRELVRLLTERVHARCPGGLVLWYDSLSEQGDVFYECELSARNAAWLSACDGVFLDYHWREGGPQRSARQAGERALDVYTGIDVWGRGTFGGGQWRCGEAMREIARGLTSLALFAPAWTYEAAGGHEQSRAAFEAREEKLWLGRDVCASALAGGALTEGDAEANAAALRCWQIDEAGPRSSGWRACEDGLLTSYQWCRRRQRVDLESGAGLSRAELDAAPRVYVAEQFVGTGPNFADKFFLRVRLLDAEGRALAEFATGELTASAEWRSVEHTFAGYGCGLRFVEWEDGGRDAESWQGHYGTKIGSSTLLIERAPVEGVASFVAERLPLLRLPFFTAFCVGVGRSLWLDGAVARRGEWFNMSLQSVACAAVASAEHVAPRRVGRFAVSLDYDRAWLGGSSLCVSCAAGVDKGSEARFLLQRFDESRAATGAEAALWVSFAVWPAARAAGVSIELEAAAGKSVRLAGKEAGGGGDWAVVEHSVRGLGPSALRAVHVCVSAPSSEAFAVHLGMLRIAAAPRSAVRASPVRGLRCEALWSAASCASDRAVWNVALQWELESELLRDEVLFFEVERLAGAQAALLGVAHGTTYVAEGLQLEASERFRVRARFADGCADREGCEATLALPELAR